MNKYLLKIATDLQIAEKSYDEEKKAIHDYSQRLVEAKSPQLKKAIEHAKEEEKTHAAGFKKVMDKSI